MTGPAGRKRFSPYFYNGITYAGILLSLLFFIVELFLFGIDFFAHGKNLYLGILTYVLLPPFLLLGLVLIPAGAFWKHRQVARGNASLEPKPIHIDLTIPSHRNALLVFSTGTLVLLIMSLIGAYKGFEYTESVEFCGLTCHQVMKPEHTAYLNSPHNRVACVECHVGAGAGSYLKYKLAGLRQMVKAATNTYKRPIETPVKNLRPAAETCEQCHSPDKLFTTKDLSRTYFLTEGEDSEWRLRMLMNVGGGAHGAPGVHAHMNVERDVYYAAEDDARQKITWVKSVARDGSETVFVTDKSKFKDAPPPAEMIRKMDCIDCHNRPTHRYEAPYRLVDDGMREGRIDPSLPGIKEQATKALAAKYKTEPEALAAIPSALAEYYRVQHPDVYASKKDAIDRSADYLKGVYSKNMFPEMKARWDAFPDNIGHLSSPGCFRCHDGEHRTMEPAGRVISRDCNACHQIIEQGPPGKLEKNLDGLPFRHPVDDDNGWKEMSCNDCHTGANP